MPFYNTRSAYGWFHKTVHWGMFTLFVFMFVTAELLMTIEVGTEALGVGKYAWYGWHKSFGMVLLALVTLRLGWKFFTPQPAPVVTTPAQHYLAEVWHWLLYGVMVAMPLSGYLMSSMGGYGVKVFGYPVPNIFGEDKIISGYAHSAHHYLAYAIYALVAVHIFAALYHHFWVRDEVLKRMLWGKAE